jgi:lipopolysaccharide transport system permease protein
MQNSMTAKAEPRLLQKNGTSAPVAYLRPARGWIPLDLAQLWAYRELIYFMTWRDVKVRYKQAVLGVGWAILQPILSMIIFTVVFNRFLGAQPDQGISPDLYPIFSFAGLLPWQFFQGALQRASISLVGNANLLTKVYFPRLIIPISAVAAGLVDFLFAFLVLSGMMLYYHLPLSVNVLWLPLFLLLALIGALAVGLWLSALNVQYRDVQHMVPFLLQAWMYASPVAYSIDVVSAGKVWRALYALNPMVGVIQGFRWALLGGSPPDLSFLISAGVVLALFVSGLYYFRHMERTFADTV